MKVSSLIVRTELEEHLNWIFYIWPKILQLCKQPNSRTEKLMFIFLFATTFFSGQLCTALEATRAKLSAFCVDEGGDFSFHDKNSQILFPLTRTECAAAQGLPWNQIFSGVPWTLQWHQHRFAIRAFGNTVMTEDPLSQRHGWAAPLMWWLICYFSLCFVFSSYLYLLNWLYHPSKAFWLKLLPVILLLV